MTLRLHGIPETISSAVCSVDTLNGAVDTVVQAIQIGVPLARVEILDDMQMKAVNAWSKLDYPELPTPFFEFHGSPTYVDEQAETVRELAAANGGGDFRRSNLRSGAVGWAIDVCVPISRLAQCMGETRPIFRRLRSPQRS